MEKDMGIVKRAKLAIEDYLQLDKMKDRDPESNAELPDPVPIAPPIGWFKQPSMFDQVREMVRGEHLRLAALAQGSETFEDANDFDVDDDVFPRSAHELEFESLDDLQARRQAEFRQQWLAERDRRKMDRELKEWEAEDRAPARGEFMEQNFNAPDPREAPRPEVDSKPAEPAPGSPSKPPQNRPNRPHSALT